MSCSPSSTRRHYHRPHGIVVWNGDFNIVLRLGTIRSRALPSFFRAPSLQVSSSSHATLSRRPRRYSAAYLPLSSLSSVPEPLTGCRRRNIRINSMAADADTKGTIQFSHAYVLKLYYISALHSPFPFRVPHHSSTSEIGLARVGPNTLIQTVGALKKRYGEEKVGPPNK